MAPPARTRNPRGSGGRLADEIVAAAIALVDESGDPSVLTLRGIARRAGITAPAIYAHFPDLAPVTAGLLDASFEELRDTVRAAMDGQGDPVTALVAAGLAYVEFGWRHPARYRLMFAAGGEAPQAVATFALVEPAVTDCVKTGGSDREH